MKYSPFHNRCLLGEGSSYRAGSKGIANHRPFTPVFAVEKFENVQGNLPLCIFGRRILHCRMGQH